MPAEDLAADSSTAKPLSYSYRTRPETPGEIVWNRVSVTATLFATAMASAFLLGRKR